MKLKLNGSLMSRDTVVAQIRDGVVAPVNGMLLPLHFKHSGSLESWLESRAIDAHRTNSRLLKKALRLATADDIETVLKVNAATITDTYWIKLAESGPANSGLAYSDVRFKENLFDKLALYGDPDSFNNGQKGIHTPELTNIGSFEKCWSMVDGEWWMYKRGSDLELFSELFVCELGKTLGFDMVQYMTDGKYILSRDFTGGAAVNYEPAFGFVGKEDDYSVNFEALLKLSERCAREYIKIIYLDTLCFNMDRHTNNYGVLRDVDSGEVVGMAPNFDNNIALISRGYSKNIKRENDLLVRLFAEFLKNSEEASRAFSGMGIPAASRPMIETCMDRVPIGADREYVCEFVMNGQELLTAALRHQA